MPAVCCLICPSYSGATWPPLPRLVAGTKELETVLRDHDIRVERVVVNTPDAALRGLRAQAHGADGLIVYIGGHGLVDAGEHYTVLDATGEYINSLDYMWTRQLAELLGRSPGDVVLFVDTCFSGQAALALDQALAVLASSPTRRGFGLVAACRAFETTGDGSFLEVLLALMREGPIANPTAWGPNDAAIRLGALVAELTATGLTVNDLMAQGASELRLIPNPRYDPGELPGRVHVKLRLRRISGGAESHLLEKSEGFIGRSKVRQRIADWLAGVSGIAG